MGCSDEAIAARPVSTSAVAGDFAAEEAEPEPERELEPMESDLVEGGVPPDVAARIVSEVWRMRGPQAVPPPEPVPVPEPEPEPAMSSKSRKSHEAAEQLRVSVEPESAPSSAGAEAEPEPEPALSSKLKLRVSAEPESAPSSAVVQALVRRALKAIPAPTLVYPIRDSPHKTYRAA
jgi:hypothetical protein